MIERLNNLGARANRHIKGLINIEKDYMTYDSHINRHWGLTSQKYIIMIQNNKLSKFRLTKFPN
jgi:hypothetical protein